MRAAGLRAAGSKADAASIAVVQLLELQQPTLQGFRLLLMELRKSRGGEAQRGRLMPKKLFITIIAIIIVVVIINTRNYVHMCVRVRACEDVYTYMYIETCMNVYMCGGMCAHVSLCARVYMYTRLGSIRARLCIYI